MKMVLRTALVLFPPGFWEILDSRDFEIILAAERLYKEYKKPASITLNPVESVSPHVKWSVSTWYHA